MIGRSPARKDAVAKASGRTLYIADLHVPDAWYGLTVRSAQPAGRLRSIHLTPDFPTDTAVFIQGADLGDRNRVQMVTDDMPFLATDRIRYLGEPIALIAAPSEDLARAAARCVRVEITPEPALFTLREAEAAYRGDAGIPDVLAEYRIERGEAERVLREAEITVAGTYTTQAQEQAYIEPQGVIAWPAARGGVTITGSLQCPYYVHAAMVRLLDCAPEDVVVRQSPTGGAFGGKEDFPTLLGGHAALLARACGHPVRMILDRHEDMLFTPKRHPSLVRHRTAVDADGRLLAMQITVLLDGGAYTTLSPVVLSRAVLHATGPYECPNVAVHGLCLRTNLPPSGAFRGFGAPQVAFAVESHMDRLAARCRLRPDEIRRRNLLRVGSTTATGQVLRESVSAAQVLEKALEASDFIRTWERCEEPRRNQPEPGNRRDTRARVRRGIGLALVWHGGGFTGSGEVRLSSLAALTVEPNNDLLIRVASVEMGQGAHTTLPQIVAERLGIPLERVSCAPPDTSQVPNSGPTVASRTIMVVGRLIERCAGELDEALRGVSGAAPAPPPDVAAPHHGADYDYDQAIARLRAAGGPLRFEARHEPPSWIHWDDKTYRGDAYAVYSFACTIAEVDVDTATGEVRVVRIVSACDIGRAIHPVVAEGQIEGGVLQGLGLALLERMGVDAARFRQNRFQTYLLPTALDAPSIIPIVIENPYSQGPGGAKGLGELPIHGPAPALANAIEQATGRRATDLPITPEAISGSTPE
ncbi:MAG: molybdopterin cofactor-binding domain-containing protein [Candidatus Eisenbacteria bacterium]